MRLRTRSERLVFRVLCRRQLLKPLFLVVLTSLITTAIFFSFRETSNKNRPTINIPFGVGVHQAVSSYWSEKIDWHDEELIRRESMRKGLYVNNIMRDCTNQRQILKSKILHQELVSTE